MLRLLGILSLGNLLFGGHRRRALRRGLLFGLLLGYLADKDFDMDRVETDVREKAGKARDAAREAVRKAKKEIRDARKAEHDRRIAEHRTAVHEEIRARKEAREQRTEERLAAIRAEAEARKARREQKEKTGTVKAEPADAGKEMQDNRDLVAELERDARTAAMAASVPTIDFPEEDVKYHASEKYGFA